ncbi:hypothetical protein KCA24_35920, partial [Escherichia coli]|nr:hypothetical protein [Escherichia coli]
AFVGGAGGGAAACFLAPPGRGALPPVVSRGPGFFPGVFGRFREIPAARAQAAALLALDDAFVSDDFAASFEAAASRAEVAASDALVVGGGP